MNFVITNSIPLQLPGCTPGALDPVEVDIDSIGHGAQRKRGRNFTTSERRLLLRLVHEYQHIIGNKNTDSQTTRRKAHAWGLLKDRFNGQVEEPRTKEQLKNLYDNIKRGKRLRIRHQKAPDNTAVTTSLKSVERNSECDSLDDMCDSFENAELKPEPIEVLELEDCINQDSGLEDSINYSQRSEVNTPKSTVSNLPSPQLIQLVSPYANSQGLNSNRLQNGIIQSKDIEKGKHNATHESLIQKELESRTFENNVLQLLQSKYKAEDEEDLSFFKSLLPSVRKLSDIQKADFRMEVLQALKKAQMADYVITQVSNSLNVANQKGLVTKLSR